MCKECRSNYKKAADGRFLLAKFQLDHILGYREPRKRMKAFATIPRDMSAAYHDVLRRIEHAKPGDRALAIRVLSWLYYAFRPLRMDELLEALVVEEGDRRLMRDDILQPEDIVDCCKSFVAYDESSGLVRFTHYTVQEFVAIIRHNLLSATDLAKACLIYLGFDAYDPDCSDCSSREDSKQCGQFGHYAAEYWDRHLRDNRPPTYIHSTFGHMLQNSAKALRFDDRETSSGFFNDVSFHVHQRDVGDREKSQDIPRAIVRALGLRRRRLSIIQSHPRGHNCDMTLLHLIARLGLPETYEWILSARNYQFGKILSVQFT